VKLKGLEALLVVGCFKNPPYYKHFDHFETSTMQNHYDKYVALFVKNKGNFKGNKKIIIKNAYLFKCPWCFK
jgi:hypothetical protein